MENMSKFRRQNHHHLKEVVGLHLPLRHQVAEVEVWEEVLEEKGVRVEQVVALEEVVGVQVEVQVAEEVVLEEVAVVREGGVGVE